jgi:hypothetical protein
VPLNLSYHPSRIRRVREVPEPYRQSIEIVALRHERYIGVLRVLDLVVVVQEFGDLDVLSAPLSASVTVRHGGLGKLGRDGVYLR